VGNLADISVFSFHPRKFITTGEGGVITTNNAQLAEWMDSYGHFGMEGHDTRLRTRFERIGTNYKMSDIQAAVGLMQMRHIEQLLTRRREIAERYHELLQGIPGISSPRVTSKGSHSWQSYVVFVEDRDRVIKELSEKGIETQIGTYSLHMHRAFSDNAGCRIIGDMSASRYAFEHCLCLPLYHEITRQEQDYVVQELIRAL